ncbi:hypothetical protein [Rhodococcus koreensis]|uniref:hypothetical protein n=1 Tax=Rhodococcus koreensis TaxID=99653 RepID=UPI0036713FE9
MTSTWLPALIGAGSALAGSFGTSFFHVRQAREERLWSRRAETYVDLLRYQGAGVTAGYRGARTAKEWAVVDDLTAKASAFGSERVRELWQQSAASSLRLNDYVEENWPEWSAVEGTEEARVEAKMGIDESLQRLVQAKDEAARLLTEKIRAELHVDSYVKRSTFASKLTRMRWTRRNGQRTA